jgi:mono/diheme cytochrome c family protein
MRRKILFYTSLFLGIVVLAIIGLLAYVKIFLPNVGPPPDWKVEITPERIERGKYLAHHVMLCMDCHSQRDWSIFSGPPITGTEGSGGEIFDQKFGFPGKYVAKNLTPTHLSNWTDGEIYRAITCGVNKDGKALFQIMPYTNFGQLDIEDIKSVIAYIRTLKPIENNLPQSESDFPMNFIINTLPQKAQHTTIPPKTNTIAYGKYILTAAGCSECHTKSEKGKVVGEYLAGGFEFPLPNGGIVRSVNITPDKKTGIGNWTKEQFIKSFKMYADSSFVPQKVKQGDFQTIMPRIMYAGMTNEDLGAIYDYIMTVKPVENRVTRFTPPSK